MKKTEASAFKALTALGFFTLMMACGLFFLRTQVDKWSQFLPFLAERGLEQTPESSLLFYKSIGALAVPPAVSSVPLSSGQFTLELNMFDKQQDAEALLNALEKRGLSAYYTPLQSQGKVLYRVRQGIFADPALAEQAKNTLWQEKHIKSEIKQL